MLFMFIAVKYMCCCPGDIDKLWSDSIRPISSWGPADSMLQSHSAIWWVIWEAALWISSFPIKTKNQKQMNNKSKTSLFKHKALKKGLLFLRIVLSLLSMTIQLGNQMKKKNMNLRFFYILLNRVPDTQE